MIAKVFALALLSAAPCDHLKQWDQALDAARADSSTWAQTRNEIAQELSPIPLPPADAEANATAELDSVRARIHAVCAAEGARAESFAPPQPKRLEEILARPEFDRARNRKSDALAAILRAAWEWLRELLQTRGAGAFAQGTRALVLGLAAAVAVIAAWRLLRRRGARRTTQGGAAAASPLKLDPPRDHLARARAELQTDPREAIREGLLALLSSLERKRLARPDRVKTNEEIAAELLTRGATAQLIDRVTPLLRWYDRTFYSLAPVEPHEAEQFLEDVSAVELTVEART